MNAAELTNALFTAIVIGSLFTYFLLFINNFLYRLNDDHNHAKAPSVIATLAISFFYSYKVFYDMYQGISSKYAKTFILS